MIFNVCLFSSRVFLLLNSIDLNMSMNFWQECYIISSWYQRVNDVIYISTREVCNNKLFKLLYVRFVYCKIISSFVVNRIFLVAQTVKNLLALKETWVWILGWGDPLKKGVATHSSILTWRIPWAEKPGGLQSMGLQSQTRLSG